MTGMRTSQNGVDLIKHFESLQLKAYKCPSGIWTIGYGHTGPDVSPSLVVTEQRAEELLEQDLEVYERAIRRLIAVPLSQYEFDALVSFTFNVGARALDTSTLRSLLNAGDQGGAADQFPRWNRSDGKPLAGLTRRRAAERALFLGEDWRVLA